MGWIRHHGIVVTCWDEKRIKKARAEAVKEFGDQVSEIVRSPVNCYLTFLIAPDGSKEGWTESDMGDARRTRFKEFLRTTPELYAEWLEYSHDVDNGSAVITTSSSDPTSQGE